MLTFAIDEVAHALRMVELRFAETTLNVTDRTSADLFNELVCGCIDDQITIVRGVRNDQKFRYSSVWQLWLSFCSLHRDDFARMAHVLPQGYDGFRCDLS